MELRGRPAPANSLGHSQSVWGMQSPPSEKTASGTEAAAASSHLPLRRCHLSPGRQLEESLLAYWQPLHVCILSLMHHEISV